MKNNYTFFEVTQCYCDELGISYYAILEEYLKALFYDKEKANELERILIQTINTNSEFFPEFNINEGTVCPSIKTYKTREK